MITVHAIRLSATEPALLLLRDGRETAGIINNRLDAETLIQALFAAVLTIWPDPEGEAAQEADKPPRAWACRQGDDCTCFAEQIEPGGCGHYQGVYE